VAVSGGSDSLALLELAREWAAPRAGRLIALTVDHGVRPEAAAEAAFVAGYCRRAGIEHQILRLQGVARRQGTLRQARHGALALAARAAGARLLLTGHTADDQAETFLMRARQGSGWYGLAGMRALSLSPAWPEGEGLLVCRPLLSQRRGVLKAVLEGRDLAWVSDPSNQDAAFERVRMRRLLEMDPALSWRVLGLCSRLGSLRAAEDSRMATILRAAVQCRAGGYQFSFRLAEEPEQAARMLGLLLQIVSGRPVGPRTASLTRIVSRLFSTERFPGATLAGCRLSCHDDVLFVAPEHPGVSPPPFEAMAWRLGAHLAILSADMKEIDAVAGKGSSFRQLMPIFEESPVMMAGVSGGKLI
jgi:tRNA(Ile)-lysidine synthase